MVTVTLEDQKLIIQSEIDTGGDRPNRATPGDEWVLISLKWYNSWRDAVDFANRGVASKEIPGPIDNRDFAAGLRVKPGMLTGTHYEVIRASMWLKLKSWYGVLPGSPVLKRPIIVDGDQSIVETSAPVFDLFVADDDDSADPSVNGDTKYAIRRRFCR